MSRVALITGGQQGIGLGIAEALGAAGFDLVLASERTDDDAAVLSALERLGPGARHVRHDVAEIAAIAALLDRVEAEVGAVTTLVSNAGVAPAVRGDMLQLLPESFDRLMAVNLRGGFFLAQEVARRMQAQARETYRSLVFVTSASAELATTERADYCISKAGASMMARLFATRLARLGIGVFEVRPGIIDTAMTAVVRDRYSERIGQGLVPAARWGTPADVGAAVLPLVEGRMAFATGAVIPVDGGLTIPRL